MLPSSDWSISAERWDGALSMRRNAFKERLLDFSYSAVAGTNFEKNSLCISLKSSMHFGTVVDSPLCFCHSNCVFWSGLSSKTDVMNGPGASQFMALMLAKGEI